MKSSSLFVALAFELHSSSWVPVAQAHAAGRLERRGVCCAYGEIADAGRSAQAHVAVDEGPRIIAVSANTPLDRTDGAALTPDGRLHLALTRGAHERLGLVGARSRTGAGAPRFPLSLRVSVGGRSSLARRAATPCHCAQRGLQARRRVQALAHCVLIESACMGWMIACTHVLA